MNLPPNLFTGNSAGELSGLTCHVVTTDVTNSYRSPPQVTGNYVIGQVTCVTHIADITHTPSVYSSSPHVVTTDVTNSYRSPPQVTPFVRSGVSNMMHVSQMISSVGDDIAVHVPQNIKQKI